MCIELWNFTMDENINYLTYISISVNIVKDIVNMCYIEVPRLNGLLFYNVVLF